MRNATSRVTVVSLVLAFGVLFVLSSRAETCPDGDLLAGRLPSRPAGILHAERLTDGVAAAEGEDWQVDLVATILSDADLTYDMGRSVRVRAAFLQGEHRGSYLLQGSTDGRDWFELWRTSAADGLGLRSRVTSELDHVLRYLRVVNPRPREAYGLTEIQISCNRHEGWPTVTIGPATLEVSPVRDSYRQHMAVHRVNVGLLGGTGFISLLLAWRRDKARGIWPALAGAAGLLLYAAVRAGYQPVEAEKWLQVAGVAAAATALGLAASVNLVAWHRRHQSWAPDRRCQVAAAIGCLGAGLYALATGVIYGALQWVVPLAAAAATAVAAVAVRGAPQRILFRYVPLLYLVLAGAFTATNFGTFSKWREVVAGQGAEAEFNSTTASGPVLYHDQFHYYLGSKFSPEIGYELLYDCSALAEVENGRGAAIKAGEITNLRTNQLEPGEFALKRASECRQKFSQDRWTAFRTDVDYFRTRVERAAVQRYLTDHGYNATPFWTAIGHVISSPTIASDSSTRLLAMLDVAYLVACVFLIAWAFAPEAAALATLVWGVGHAWFFINVGGFGSFGRFDWLFAAVAAICLLKKQSGGWGAFSLAASSLLRVFPAALFFGPGARGLYQLWRNRRLDAELRRVLAGGLAGFIVLVPLSILGTDSASYGEFAKNSQKHATSPISNYMGLRTMFYWDPATHNRLKAERKFEDPTRIWKEQRAITFAERKAWYALAVAALIGLTILLCLRSSEIWLITLAGVVPMFCLFDLTNYFYAIMALFAVWAYRSPQHTAVLLALALGGTLVFVHLGWWALGYVVNSALVLAMLCYFLVSSLLQKRVEALTLERTAGTQ